MILKFIFYILKSLGYCPNASIAFLVDSGPVSVAAQGCGFGQALLVRHKVRKLLHNLQQRVNFWKKLNADQSAIKVLDFQNRLVASSDGPTLDYEHELALVLRLSESQVTQKMQQDPWNNDKMTWTSGSSEFLIYRYQARSNEAEAPETQRSTLRFEYEVYLFYTEEMSYCSRSGFMSYLSWRPKSWRPKPVTQCKWALWYLSTDSAAGNLLNKLLVKRSGGKSSFNRMDDIAALEVGQANMSELLNNVSRGLARSPRGIWSVILGPGDFKTEKSIIGWLIIKDIIIKQSDGWKNIIKYSFEGKIDEGISKLRQLFCETLGEFLNIEKYEALGNFLNQVPASVNESIIQKTIQELVTIIRAMENPDLDYKSELDVPQEMLMFLSRVKGVYETQRRLGDLYFSQIKAAYTDGHGIGDGIEGMDKYSEICMANWLIKQLDGIFRTGENHENLTIPLEIPFSQGLLKFLEAYRVLYKVVMVRSSDFSLFKALELYEEFMQIDESGRTDWITINFCICLLRKASPSASTLAEKEFDEVANALWRALQHLSKWNKSKNFYGSAEEVIRELNKNTVLRALKEEFLTIEAERILGDAGKSDAVVIHDSSASSQNGQDKDKSGGTTTPASSASQEDVYIQPGFYRWPAEQRPLKDPKAKHEYITEYIAVTATHIIVKKEMKASDFPADRLKLYNLTKTTKSFTVEVPYFFSYKSFTAEVPLFGRTEIECKAENFECNEFSKLFEMIHAGQPDASLGSDTRKDGEDLLNFVMYNWSFWEKCRIILKPEELDKCNINNGVVMVHQQSEGGWIYDLRYFPTDFQSIWHVYYKPAGAVEEINWIEYAMGVLSISFLGHLQFSSAFHYFFLFLNNYVYKTDCYGLETTLKLLGTSIVENPVRKHQEALSGWMLSPDELFSNMTTHDLRSSLPFICWDNSLPFYYSKFIRPQLSTAFSNEFNNKLNDMFIKRQKLGAEDIGCLNTFKNGIESLNSASQDNIFEAATNIIASKKVKDNFFCALLCDYVKFKAVCVTLDVNLSSFPEGVNYKEIQIINKYFDSIKSVVDAVKNKESTEYISAVCSGLFSEAEPDAVSSVVNGFFLKWTWGILSENLKNLRDVALTNLQREEAIRSAQKKLTKAEQKKDEKDEKWFTTVDNKYDKFINKLIIELINDLIVPTFYVNHTDSSTDNEDNINNINSILKTFEATYTELNNLEAIPDGRVAQIKKDLASYRTDMINADQRIPLKRRVFIFQYRVFYYLHEYAKFKQICEKNKKDHKKLFNSYVLMLHEASIFATIGYEKPMLVPWQTWSWNYLMTEVLTEEMPEVDDPQRIKLKRISNADGNQDSSKALQVAVPRRAVSLPKPVHKTLLSDRSVVEEVKSLPRVTALKEDVQLHSSAVEEGKILPCTRPVFDTLKHSARFEMEEPHYPAYEEADSRVSHPSKDLKIGTSMSLLSLNLLKFDSGGKVVIPKGDTRIKLALAITKCFISSLTDSTKRFSVRPGSIDLGTGCNIFEDNPDLENLSFVDDAHIGSQNKSQKVNKIMNIWELGITLVQILVWTPFRPEFLMEYMLQVFEKSESNDDSTNEFPKHLDKFLKHLDELLFEKNSNHAGTHSQSRQKKNGTAVFSNFFEFFEESGKMQREDPNNNNDYNINNINFLNDIKGVLMGEPTLQQHINRSKLELYLRLPKELRGFFLENRSVCNTLPIPDDLKIELVKKIGRWESHICKEQSFLDNETLFSTGSLSVAFEKDGKNLHEEGENLVMMEYGVKKDNAQVELKPVLRTISMRSKGDEYSVQRFQFAKVARDCELSKMGTETGWYNGRPFTRIMFGLKDVTLFGRFWRAGNYDDVVKQVEKLKKFFEILPFGDFQLDLSVFSQEAGWYVFAASHCKSDLNSFVEVSQNYKEDSEKNSAQDPFSEVNNVVLRDTVFEIDPDFVFVVDTKEFQLTENNNKNFRETVWDDLKENAKETIKKFSGTRVFGKYNEVKLVASG
jgi:hypothetical protein